MSTIALYLPLNISETVRDRSVAWFQRTISRIWPAVTFGSRRCGLTKSLLQLRQVVRLAVRSLSEDASKPLVQAFVSCHLNYCNSLFFRMSEGLLWTAVAVGSERRRPSGDWYSTFIYAGALSATWLPVRQSFDFKVATLVHPSLSGISPSYLPNDAVLSSMFASDDYVPQLSNVRCDVDTYCTFGDRGFAAAGPGLWNYLPSHEEEADLSYNRFRRSLKTFLFG